MSYNLKRRAQIFVELILILPALIFVISVVLIFEAESRARIQKIALQQKDLQEAHRNEAPFERELRLDQGTDRYWIRPDPYEAKW